MTRSWINRKRKKKKTKTELNNDREALSKEGTSLFI